MRDMELELESTHESNPEAFLGGLLGESEYEFESLGEGPLGEGPLGEGPLGEGPLGEGPMGEGPLGELELENEQFFGLGEGEGFGDQEAELFFGKLRKAVGGIAKRFGPILKTLAQKAAPIVGTAIGGPLGGKIASTAANLLLKEGELEGFDHEFEMELEAENEAEMEAVMEGPLTEQQALGELMAAAASKAVSDFEAEAQAGASTVISLSPQDRDTMRAVLPSIARGVAVLTRILRAQPQPEVRSTVRVIPTIVKRTAVQIRKHADAGRPVTKKLAARAMATQTRRVLGNPAVCGRAMQRNVRATQAIGRKIRTSQPKPRSRYAY
jgi:hypothetical protein